MTKYINKYSERVISLSDYYDLDYDERDDYVKVVVGESSSSSEKFIVSGIIGAVTDSALLGGLLGGSFFGGILGDSADGDLFD